MPFASYNALDHLADEWRVWNFQPNPMPDQYFGVLGRVLIACSNLEGEAHNAIRAMVDLDVTLVRAFVGSPRFDNLLNTIADLMKHGNHTEPQKKLFSETRRLASYAFSIRAIIAHQTPAWQLDWLRFDKYHSAKDTRIREALLYYVRLDELRNL